MPSPVRLPALLAPAGDLPSLSAALKSGADAVYFGTTLFNMRARAKNFEVNQLPLVVERAHHQGAKAYLTLNVQVYDGERSSMERLLDAASRAQVDALIAWDPMVLLAARERGIPLHISTQASISNLATALFYESLGAKAVVLARELSLKQVREIKQGLVLQGSSLAVEVFAHGAMCVAVSGRCFMSQAVFQQSGNRGACLQPCRRAYRITDLSGEITFDLEAHTVMSPRDLCTLPLLEQLVKAGVDLLKLEGRARSPEYVGEVTAVYREALTALGEGALTSERRAGLMARLEQVYNKSYHTGFYEGLPSGETFATLENSAATQRKRYIGRVERVYRRAGVFDLQIHTGAIAVGSTLRVIGNRVGVVDLTIVSLRNEEEAPIQRAEKGALVGVKPRTLPPLRPGDKVFQMVKQGGEL